MTDPFGAIHNQDIGDVGIYIGNGQWAASSKMLDSLPAQFNSAGGEEVTGGLGSTLGRRIQVFDGSVDNPVTAASGVIMQPSLYMSRTIYANNWADYGSIWSTVKSLVTAVGSPTQANNITAYIDQHASADAQALGGQVILENVSGAGFGLFTNSSNVSHICTISHAAPCVVTVSGDDMLPRNDLEIKLYSSGATLPAGLTNLARYFVSIISDGHTFYVSTLPSIAISSISAATDEITTASPHGMATNDYVWISGTTTTPTVNGLRQITKTGASTFTVGVNVTSGQAGAAGTTSFKLVETTSDGTGPFYITGNAVWGYNPVIINSSNMPIDYDGGAGVAMSAIFVQPLSSTRGGNALRVLGNPSGPLSEGLVFDAGSVYGQTFYDTSDSLTSLYIGGSHTDGIDLSTGTYSGSPIKFGAGASWTPTITSSVGTITTVSAGGEYLLLGKYLRYSVTIIMTTNGTGAGALQFSLPLSLNANASYVSIGAGVNANTAVGLRTVSQGGANNVSIVTDAAGAYPIADGQTIYVSGWIGLA